MRIPISESELGLWYPMKNGYYFLSKSNNGNETFIERISKKINLESLLLKILKKNFLIEFGMEIVKFTEQKQLKNKFT